MEVPLQYVLSFNPPMCYKNLLLGEVSLIKTEGNWEILRLKPEQYTYVYEFIHQNTNPKDKGKAGMPKYSWVLQKDRTTQVATSADYLYNDSRDMIFHSREFLEGKSSTTYDLNKVVVSFEAADFEVRNNEYDNFKLRDMVYSSTLSKKMVIYSPYMVVNRTMLPLVLGNGRKKNDLEMIGNSSEYFNPGKETKLFIRSEEYSWSQEFDFTTIGVSGMLSLQRTKAGKSYKPVVKEYNSNEIDIGVRISQMSTTFYKTVVISFAPRYVICNSCSTPIVVANHHKNSQVQLAIGAKEEKVYFFENKIDISNCIKVRNPRSKEIESQALVSYSNIKQEEWSSIFEIHDIADFHIEMTSKEENKEEPEIWYLPSQNNGYKRYIRVLITTQDEATLFITFSDPYKPECVIKNETDEVIFIKQKKVGTKRAIRANTTVPFTWEDLSSKVQKALNVYTDTNKR